MICKLFYFVQNLAYSCSVLILTLISLERYMAIKHPMLNRRFSGTRAVHGVVIGAAWLLSIVYSLPWLVAYDIVRPGGDDNAAFCFNSLPLDTHVYAMVNFVVLYIAPLLFMTFVYVRISIILWRSSAVMSLPLISLQLLQSQDHHHEQQQQQQQQNLGGVSQYLQRASTPSCSPSCVRPFFNSLSSPNSPYLSAKSTPRRTCTQLQLNVNGSAALTATTAAERQRKRCSAAETAPLAASSRRSTVSHAEPACRSRLSQMLTEQHPLTSRRKVVRLLAAIVVSFALCMLPHHVRVQWQEWRRSATYLYEEMYIPPVTTLLFYVNSCLNPLLYALISDKFRQAFADLRCCRRHAAPPPRRPVATALATAPPRIGRSNSQPYLSRPVHQWLN